MRYLGDSNLFLALAVGQHSHHQIARHWFEALSSGDTVSFCRASQISFLRLLTQKIAANYQPISNEYAWQVYELLSKDDAIDWGIEPAGLESVWQKFANAKSALPKSWMDAYLAAFAFAGNYKMVTFDHDFSRFDSLDWIHLKN